MENLSRRQVNMSGVTLPSAVLEQVDYSESSVKDVTVGDLRAAKTWLRSANVSRISATNAHFAYVDGRDSSFVSIQISNLAATDIDCVGARFSDSMFKGYAERGNFRSVSFEGCTFEAFAFRGMKMTFVKFSQCILRNVSFIDCDLSFSTFVKSDISDIELINCKEIGTRHL